MNYRMMSGLNDHLVRLKRIIKEKKKIHCESIIIKAIEFFVNAEHAYRMLLISYKEAKKRNRNDLVEKYKSEMTEMVKICCYSEVASSLKGKE